LLSARDRLLIFHVGQSVRDNTTLQPSAVVSELVDTLRLSFRGAGGDIEGHVVLRHPLQPFSPRYFDPDSEPRLFSYSQLQCDAARGLVAGGSEERRFVTGALPERMVEAIDVDELARFFENPTRAFLQSRLGVYLGHDATALESREPVDLDPLESWKLGDSLVKRILDDDEVDWRAHAMRSGDLPLGALGERTLAEIEPEARRIAEVAGRGREGPRLPPHEVSLDIDGVRIGGTLRDLWRGGQQRVQFSRLGRRQEIGMWVRHLVLNSIEDDGLPRTTTIVGRPQRGDVYSVSFRAVEAADLLLAELVGFYRDGMRRPLPLFESSSWAYVANMRKKSDRKGALRGAAKKFVKSGPDAAYGGDSSDPYVEQVYGQRPPFGESPPVADPGAEGPSFETAAMVVLGPMLDHRDEQE
jgi:exodeoxyribonuclease V gamma subunit